MSPTDIREQFKKETKWVVTREDHYSCQEYFSDAYVEWLESELLRLRKENEWHNAEVIQPDTDRDVLIRFKTNQRQYIGYYDHGVWAFLSYDGIDFANEFSDPVSEWRELPSSRANSL